MISIHLNPCLPCLAGFGGLDRLQQHSVLFAQALMYNYLIVIASYMRTLLSMAYLERHVGLLATIIH
jgi:hypothetical protein